MRSSSPGPGDFDDGLSTWRRYTDAARSCAGPFIAMSLQLQTLLRESVLRLRLPPTGLGSEPIFAWRTDPGPWRAIPPPIADDPPFKLDYGDPHWTRNPQPLTSAEKSFFQSLLDSESKIFPPTHFLLRALEEPLPHLRVLFGDLAAELSLKEVLAREGDAEIKKKRIKFPALLRRFYKAFGEPYPEWRELLKLHDARNQIVHRGDHGTDPEEAAAHFRTATRTVAHALSLCQATEFLSEAVVSELLPRIQEEYVNWREPWWNYEDSEPDWMRGLLPSTHFGPRVESVLPDGLVLEDAHTQNGWWHAEIRTKPEPDEGMESSQEPPSSPPDPDSGPVLELSKIPQTKLVLSLEEMEDDLADEDYCSALLDRISQLKPPS